MYQYNTATYASHKHMAPKSGVFQHWLKHKVLIQMSVVCNVSATFMLIANINLHPTLLQHQAICTSKDPELNYAFKLNLHYIPRVKLLHDFDKKDCKLVPKNSC